MSLPVPLVAELEAFEGVPTGSLGPFAGEALIQSIFLIQIVGRIKDLPDDPELVQLIKYAAMEMAYKVYNEQPYIAMKANGLTSETIGSYSYSRSATVKKALNEETTGLLWFDLLMDRLRELFGSDAVTAGGITVFEHDNVYHADDGTLWVRTPAEQIAYHGFGGLYNVETAVQTSGF